MLSRHHALNIVFLDGLGLLKGTAGTAEGFDLGKLGKQSWNDVCQMLTDGFFLFFSSCCLPVLPQSGVHLFLLHFLLTGWIWQSNVTNTVLL